MTSRQVSIISAMALIVILALLIYQNQYFVVKVVDEEISKRVRSISHHFENEIIASQGNFYRLAELFEIYKRENPEILGFAIVDRSGKVVFYSGDKNAVVEVLTSVEKNVEVLKYSPEKHRYHFFKPLKSEILPSVSGIAFNIDISDRRREILTIVFLIFSALAILVILSFIAVAEIINRRIVKPVKNISTVIQGVSRGIYNVNLDVRASPEIADLFENFNQMVRLLDEKERRLEKQNKQFKVIARISHLGLKSKSLNEFYKELVELIRDEFNFLNVAYFSVEGGKILKLIAVSGYLEGSLELETRILEASALIGEPVVINDAKNNPLYLLPADIPIGSELAVPVKRKNRVVGIIDISSEKANAFSSEDVKVFQTIANEVSIVLESFESTMENVRLLFKLETVYKMTQSLVLTKDIDKIFEEAVKLIYSVLGKRELVVEIYELTENILVMKSVYGTFKGIPYDYAQSVNEGLIGKAVRERKTIYSPDIAFEADAKRYYIGTVSELVVPIGVGDEIIGAINCESEIFNAFDDVDILVVQTIADLLGIAVLNAKIFQELSKSETRYRTIFENSGEAIFRMDESGKIIEFNPAFVKMFGFELGEKINIYELFADGAQRESFKELISKLNFVKGFNADLKNKDGEILNTKISIARIEDTKSSSVHYDGVIVDLTEYNRLVQKLGEIERLRGLARIAGGIAHEFNNVFAGILGSAQLIKMKAKDDEKLFHYADIIERATTRGANLVKKLGGFARGGRRRIARFNLNDIARDVLQKLPESTWQNIKLKTEFSQCIPPIEGDREQITDMFYELVLNAIEAMPNGGTLTIKTDFKFWENDMVKDEPDFVPGEYVSFSVEDTGLGISNDVLKYIFEPFFTTKRELGKSGLGLSMVYGIVKNHKGYIFVQTEKDAGTTFTVLFPPANETAIYIGETGGRNKKDKLKILIVDDEEFLRIILSDLLSNLGHNVIQASNGVEAIRIFQTIKDEIDLVVLDVVMPLKDGFETFKELRKINPDIKIILASGYTTSEISKVVSGVNVSFVQKPFRLEEIEKAIRELFKA